MTLLMTALNRTEVLLLKWCHRDTDRSQEPPPPTGGMGERTGVFRAFGEEGEYGGEDEELEGNKSHRRPVQAGERVPQL